MWLRALVDLGSDTCSSDQRNGSEKLCPRSNSTCKEYHGGPIGGDYANLQANCPGLVKDRDEEDCRVLVDLNLPKTQFLPSLSASPLQPLHVLEQVRQDSSVEFQKPWGHYSIMVAIDRFS